MNADEQGAEAIYTYIEATDMQGASFYPFAYTAKRRWINAYKAVAGAPNPDTRKLHGIFMQALHNGAERDAAYDAVLDAMMEGE